jgi:hypothetical protein
MKKTLKRIAPLQLGKVLGAVYGLISLIFLPFLVVFTIIASLASHQGGGASLAPIVGSLVLMIFIPIAYAALGFVFGALGAWVYNIISKWIGGIEVDVE